MATLYHHENTDYETAAARARGVWADRFEGIIQKGHRDATAALEKIERDQPRDILVPAFQVNYNDAMDQPVRLTDAAGEDFALDLTSWSEGQFFNSVGLPKGYVTKLRGMGLRDLVSDNVRALLDHRVEQKGNPWLVRMNQEGTKIKGWLSNSYKRFDSRPVFETFALMMKANGTLPLGGGVTETRAYLRGVSPKVEWLGGDPILPFWEVRTSDVGNGRYQFNFGLMRGWCTNLATMDDIISKVHLGGRLDESAVYSQRTIQLETEAVVSAFRDVAEISMGEDRVQKFMGCLRSAAVEEMDAKQAYAVAKRRMSEEESNQVAAFFSSPDATNLPAGNTKWRFSNAISWLAQSDTVSADRALELQDFAGEVLR